MKNAEALLNKSLIATKFQLKVLHNGVGDVTATDLSMAQIESEENKERRIHFYCFNVGIGGPAKQWLKKNAGLKCVSAFCFKEHNVFLDILADIRNEMVLKYPKLLEEDSKPEEFAPKTVLEAPAKPIKKKTHATAKKAILRAVLPNAIVPKKKSKPATRKKSSPTL
jgi:hypothetical protein